MPWSIRSSRARVHFTSRSKLDWCCPWFTESRAVYIRENDFFSDLFERFLLAFCRLRGFFPRRPCPVLLLFFLLYLLPLNLEIFRLVWRHIVFLDREFLPQQPRVELKVHWQQIFMRSKQLLPAFGSLKDLCVNARVDVLIRQQTGSFD